MTMHGMINEQRQQDPSLPLGMIPMRMPVLSYGGDGLRFTDIDPLTGVQRNPSLRYDVHGAPYNATPGSPESFRSLGEAILLSALARSAIAPEWEAETMFRQIQFSAPEMGLTEEERAGRTDGLAPAVTGDTQTWRPVVLDLDAHDGEINTMPDPKELLDHAAQEALSTASAI
ncbi:MAG: hypothetical protein ACOY3Z_07565 [Thermodesulfobacteriota bacterium]